jgi:hypothetical protein
MAPQSPISESNDLETWGDRPAHERLLVWLGVLNGLLLGTAVAVGAWGAEFFRLADLPVDRPYGSLALSSALLLLLCALVGWLTARWRIAWLTVLLWTATAVLITTIIAHTPSTLQTAALWLADGRFWGMPLFPHPAELTFAAYLVSGIFMILAMILLSIFQDPRLQSIGREFLGGQRPGFYAWIKFLLPLLIAATAGAITGSMYPNPNGATLQAVQQGIHAARTHEGDLFVLGLEDGMNYAAFNPVRDRLNGPYTLSVAAIDQATSTVIVMANFDSGVWIRCRLLNEQLSFCDDASLPYHAGLAHLLTGAPLPEDCRGCVPAVMPELSTWLAEQGVRFAGEPHITRQAGEGSVILMRAEDRNGRFAIECWFSGQPRVQLDRCIKLSG